MKRKGKKGRERRKKEKGWRERYRNIQSRKREGKKERREEEKVGD